MCDEFFESFTNGGKLSDDLAELIRYLTRIHIIHYDLLILFAIVRWFRAVVVERHARFLRCRLCEEN